MFRITALNIALVVLATFLVASAQAAEPTSSELLFAVKLHPLLQAKCLACHGRDGDDVKGELDLTTRQGALQGGESDEPAIVPGKPEESPLYLAISWQGLEMPPKENDRLKPDEIKAFATWIAAGAPWPDAHRIAELKELAARQSVDELHTVVATSGGTTEDWTNRAYAKADLWALQPLRQVDLPAHVHPIDELVRRRRQDLQTANQLPNLPHRTATRRELIRRMTYGLTGLPAALAEVEAFENDRNPDAINNLISRLLDSQHYGEHWGQHWLDVVRYADSAGFANDFERPHAWRYRDYVIRSLNNDKPFDRFLMEQLAGDELDSSDPDCLIGSGFLRLGPWEHTGMSVETVTRQSFLDDVTNAVGETFLGINMTCFKCHDHKFDPLPTKDYYRFQAVFAPTQFGDRELPFQACENTDGFEVGRRRSRQLLQEAEDYQALLNAKSKAAKEALLQEYGVKNINQLPPEIRQTKARHSGLSDLEKSLQKITNKRIAYYRRELARYEPFAMSVYNGPFPGYAGIQNKPTLHLPEAEKREGTAQVVHILRGGALESPGDPVSPGILSAVGPQLDIPPSTDGRRLALARWLTSDQHPLTARVIVNRVWHYHFGRGLFATPNAVGKMGSKPTHPQLLDELARRFVADGWSLKKLHRLILTSQTYQQSAALPPSEWLEADPNNERLTHFAPRRLSAEELRDAMLSITGELNPEMGGPGCFPEINWDVALQPRQIMGTVAPAYQPSRTPEERNRRTIYTVRIRTLADPMMEVFNRPGTDFSCAVRDETTVTPQVFSLFNGQFAHDRAIALAHKISQEFDSEQRQVAAVFEALLQRTPTVEQRDVSLQHYQSSLAHHQQKTPTAIPVPTKVKRGMVEELTGDLYEFEDQLTLMEDYVSDLKPWQVDAKTRALAELCLVLINSNEFVYVY